MMIHPTTRTDSQSIHKHDGVHPEEEHSTAPPLLAARHGMPRVHQQLVDHQVQQRRDAEGHEPGVADRTVLHGRAQVCSEDCANAPVMQWV